MKDSGGVALRQLENGANRANSEQRRLQLYLGVWEHDKKFGIQQMKMIRLWMEYIMDVVRRENAGMIRDTRN